MASFSPNSEDHSSSPQNRDKWTVEEANRVVPRRLIDHEEDWSEDLKKKIEGNERLQKLRAQGRNKIAGLPDHEFVVRQFYCSVCKEIPFPWAKNPETSMLWSIMGIPKSQHISIPKVVFLCDNGHPICRTCIQMFQSCPLSASDCDYMFQKETPEGPGELAAEEKLSLVPLCDPDSDDESQSNGNGEDDVNQSIGSNQSEEDVEIQSTGTIGSGEDDETQNIGSGEDDETQGIGSWEDDDIESIENFRVSLAGLGNWGQIRHCRAYIDPTNPYMCTFLTEMIKNTEFACRYFYNWCDFHGKGEKLSDHEALCPNAPKDANESAASSFSIESLSKVASQLEQSDDDDAAILNLDLNTLQEEAYELLIITDIMKRG